MLCASLYTGFLYFKNKKNGELKKPQLIGLSIVRFITVFLITLLLLEPLFQHLVKKVEKPTIVLLQDTSESIIARSDSSFLKNDYPTAIESLTLELSNKYDVETYSFDDKITPLSFSFDGKQTDISQAIESIEQKYYNRNLGAIILASDGIYNKGASPFYASKKLKNVPVYTISLGDTSSVKDVYIDQVINNRLAYKGNKFPVQVSIKSAGFEGKNTTVSISKNGTKLASSSITLPSKNTGVNIPFELEATQVGLQRYTVTVASLAGEYTLTNNTKDFYIDVLESKQKILFLHHAPHPDISAVKSAIETNENYEIEVITPDKLKSNVKGYNLVIIHDLPSRKYPLNDLMIQLKNQQIPSFYLIGTQTDLNKINQLKLGIEIPPSNSFSDAQSVVNNGFSLFKYSENLEKGIGKFPPLKVPFSQKYKVSNATEIFLFQKIGLTKTNYPLVAFNKQASTKNGFVLGEGLFRWKLSDYLENENNLLFNEIIQQSVQYLVARENKSFFKVFNEKSFDEGSPVLMEAEVYNKSYELDNNSEVSIKITNEEGKEFPYNFSKTSNRYQLNAGILPTGTYTFEATTNANGQKLSQKGEFSIKELTVEKNNTVANHKILSDISEYTGGKSYTSKQINQLANDIMNREDLAAVIYSQKEVEDLINLKWLFFLLLGLLSIEWFFRKRLGLY